VIGTPTNTELIDRNGTTFVKLTYTCMWCEQPNQVEVVHEEYRDWVEKGMLIQNAMPTTSAADREVLMTGSHAKCWDEGMKEPIENADDVATERAEARTTDELAALRSETDECDHEDVECDDTNCPCKCSDCPAEGDIEDPYDPTSDDGTVAHDSLEKPSYGS
jgi:hypothetical protein